MGFDWINGWCRAILSACSRGHLEMLTWLVMHPTGQQVLTAWDQTGFVEVSQQVFVLAAEEGHVAVLRFLFEKKYVAQCEVALVRAVRNDHLEVVKWLVQNCSLSSSNSTDCVVEEAAKGGRLKILQFLHGMERTVAFRDYFIGRWSHKVMDLAAGQGHLDVIKWLSNARSEGCSTKAMDDAAANGHLTAVKWLHRHRSEGGTRAGMDDAATNDFLEVVQWLDTNTKAGCTTKAMDEAAKNGHLEVLRWLHNNRTEGCSADAINDAVDSNHTHVVWWHHHHYPRLTPSKKNVWIQAPNQFDMLLLWDGLFPTMFDTENTRRPAVGIRSEPNDVLALQWLYEKVPGVHEERLKMKVMNDLFKGLPPEWIVYGTDLIYEQVSSGGCTPRPPQKKNKFWTGQWVRSLVSWARLRKYRAALLCGHPARVCYGLHPLTSEGIQILSEKISSVYDPK